jgi:polyferredoxin
MDKMGAPRGLVRYSTQSAMEQDWNPRQQLDRLLRPRVLMYGALLAGVAVWFVVGLSLRNPLKFDVIRDRGVLARTVGQGDVENVYRLQIMHALEHPQRYTIRVSGPGGMRLSDGSPSAVRLESAAERLVSLAVHLPARQAAELAGQNVPIAFHLMPEGAPDGAEDTIESSRFIVPK